MKDFWIGTGWKMNKTAAAARSYIATLLPLLPALPADVSVFVVPPFTALPAAREAAAGSPLLIGAQNVHWAEEGAYTGEVSVLMLEEFAIDLVELGHSERRQMFGETDEAINRKVKLALAHGMTPLVCVGDSAAERDAGASAEAIIRQMKLAFAGLSPADVGRCLVAYEPIWAIGEAGVPATPEHVRAVQSRLQGALADRAGSKVPVLYGGSVNLGNAAALAAEPAVDGLFIGRAAWKAEGFAALIGAALKARAMRPAA
jgi:triosephosphate isomerase